MNEYEFGGIVFDFAVKVHMRLCPGLLDCVYKAVQFCDSGEALMMDGISRFINGKLE